jgi:hypothetical protein
MLDDPRLKRFLTYYPKESDEPEGEIEIAGLTASELRQILGLEAGCPLVDVYEVSPEAAGRLSELLGVELDPRAFDYFFETVVRKEYLSTYYEEEGPPYPPPENLWAFPDARRARSKR